MQEYATGQKITAEVYQILPHFGVLVRLEDGTPGYIRRRELSWSEQEPDPRQLLKIGQEVPAVVLNRDKTTGSLSLSLRLAERDPWEEIEQKYSLNKAVSGTVTGILPRKGAFVELEPGVDAFLPISHIHPDKELQSVEEVLWMEDRVRALVISLDPSRRHLHLSIRAYLKQLRRERAKAKKDSAEAFSLENLLDPRTKKQLYQIVDNRATPPKSFWRSSQPLNVLIIDDNPDFGNPLAEWLKHIGYHPHLAINGEEGIAEFSRRPYDLLILDSHLPDTPGVAVAEKIRQDHPKMPILFVTGYEYNRDLERASQLGLSIWLKPLREQDLIEILTHLEKEQELPPASFSRQEAPFGFIDDAPDTRVSSLTQALQHLLVQLSKDIKVEYLALLALDFQKQEITLEAGKGVFPLSEEQRHNLIYSPVRDVLQQGAVVFQNQVTKKRFQYLLKWFSFRSCIGVPVYTFQQSQSSYGLFVFHSAGGFFKESHVLRVQSAAAFMGAALTQEHIRRQLRNAQRWILQGQLGAGILHEVNNRIGGALLTAKTSQSQLQGLQNPRPEDLATLQEHVEKMVDNLNQTSESIHLFRKLSREERWETFQINHALRTMIDLLKPVAAKNKVDIQLNPGSDLPPLTSVGVRLDQVFCNVMMNAVEWMAYQPGAQLEVVSGFEKDDRQFPLKIYFRDMGPGIHRALFDKVYDLGFTNKKGGTGLGLFIAKLLIESVNGRMRIIDSNILIGTTFLIELPVDPQTP